MPDRKITEYRERASDVRLIAQHTPEPDLKQALADIANSWESMAADREKRARSKVRRVSRERGPNQ